jgi:DNA-binding response OmpR family regulator
VSPISEDHRTIERILNQHSVDSGAEPGWRLTTTSTLAGAMTKLNDGCCPVVVCERDVPPGSWRDLLETTRSLADPPALIVTSRHADDSLWAEALNLGVYDVLAKPFDEGEFTRVLHLAWAHWGSRWAAAEHHASCRAE